MLLFAHLGLALFAANFVKRLDLAFVALGSLLPDIIDKPLGAVVFGTPAMGRTFAHTLLFLLLIVTLAAYARDIRLLSLSGGVLSHLILDSMWNSPIILLWPLLGSFPAAEHVDVMGYFEMLIMGLRSPEVLVPECLGFAYILYFLIKRRLMIVTRVKEAAAHSKDGPWASVHILLRGS
jgi:inner membrane protein